MANPFFRFKQFTVWHDRSAMKVTTDACLFGAWVASRLRGSAVGHALDIGTGTGLLSLMVAQQCSAPIDAVEIDPQAAMQAMENRTAAGFGNITVLTGDLLQLDLPRYDVIFSNPPFYEKEIESGNAGRRTAHHADGLTWNELFAFITRHLAPGGTAYLLLPYKRRKDLDALLRREGLYLYEEIAVRPSTRQSPSRLMVALGSTEREVQSGELLIANESGYSPEFVALLRDYYLYL
ncbi:tRNA1(Val) (adenine(37)-N6)-methyltransferase [Flaviaesturariibacter flavus]|nr:methyltransferase [Flaviaesturariibacter flavus]